MCIVLAGALAASAALCFGANIQITPVVHEIVAPRQAISMSVANQGGGPATLQVRAFHWTQEDGQEQLTPAPEVILSPAIFNVEAGRTQVVRALFSSEPAAQEKSYRLLVDELPDASSIVPVRFALRVSMPVFRVSAGQAPAALVWRLEARSHRLIAMNNGGTRERLHDMVLTSSRGEQVKPESPWGMYLLAGLSRSWLVSQGDMKPGDRWVLTAQTDRGRIDVPIVVSP